MRNLCDIIEAVKDGEKPEYDEIRYALLAVDALLYFANNDVKKLLKEPVNPLVKELIEKDNFKRFHSALNKDPKSYVGNQDPDLPEYQEDRARSKLIYENFMKKYDKEKADKP